MNKDLVRHNINFLEYPIWFQDERLAEKRIEGMTWKDLDGFEYRAGYKMPTKTDAIFLLYLLLQCQNANYAQEITLTRYQVLKDCDLHPTSEWYDRLKDSLERWKMVGIKFEGTFYDGNNYKVINFGVIDSWSLHEETKKLNVTFSPAFIKMMLGKGFFKYINFNEFKQLRSPLASRLYEILIKSYQGRDEWEIDALLLAQKIPMAEHFPAHIVAKIRRAVDRINRSTDLRFAFSTRRSAKDGKKTILVFKKIENIGPLPKAKKAPSFALPETPEMKALVALLPPERQAQRTILEIVVEACKKFDAEYVARNIRYANKHAKRSYRAYLKKALADDYGLAMQEDEQVLFDLAEVRDRKAEEEATKRAEKIRHEEMAMKVERELQERVIAYLAQMDEAERVALEARAIAGLKADSMLGAYIGRPMVNMRIAEILGWRKAETIANA